METRIIVTVGQCVSTIFSAIRAYTMSFTRWASPIRFMRLKLGLLYSFKRQWLMRCLVGVVEEKGEAQ
jgi:hypothetical protein